jgi:hypothetical protein
MTLAYAPLDPARRSVLAGALALLVLVLAACGGGAPAEDQDATGSAAATEDVRAARAALGPPAVALAEAVIGLRDLLDRARHEVERGAPMAAELEAVPGQVTAVRAAADDAEAALGEVVASARPAGADAEDAGAAPVGAALDAVTAAVAEARSAADAAEDEHAALLALAELDRRLEAAAAAWEEPGSQSERRVTLGALADDLDAIAGEAAALPVAPAACPALPEQRERWAELLAEHSRRLQERATSGGGAEYDELRRAFGRDPFGEDRRAADAADRDCWRAASPVAEAAQRAPENVEALEDALNP